MVLTAPPTVTAWAGVSLSLLKTLMRLPWHLGCGDEKVQCLCSEGDNLAHHDAEVAPSGFRSSDLKSGSLAWSAASGRGLQFDQNSNNNCICCVCVS